ncbi:MAG: hypothetical protein U1E87_07290 [Alphaproteobacteria bacterium]
MKVPLGGQRHGLSEFEPGGRRTEGHEDAHSPSSALAFAGIALFQRQLLYHPHKEIVAPVLPGVERIEIKTPDGETLTAWWRAPQPHGIVFLFFDGNGGAPEQWSARWREISEANAGFLAVYYRGYSGSTGHPTEAGLMRDARAGYQWLIDKDVDPREIVIHGFSLGSGVAVQLAAAHPLARSSSRRRSRRQSMSRQGIFPCSRFISS